MNVDVYLEFQFVLLTQSRLNNNDDDELTNLIRWKLMYTRYLPSKFHVSRGFPPACVSLLCVTYTFVLPN